MNGLYIDVFYKNVLVCRGKIIRTKQNDGAHEMYLVSIDNKYFFNLSHPYVTFIFTSPDNETYIRLPEKVVKWRDCPTNQDEYVYEENDINELDEEVKHLVAALNQLQYIETNGSCSGHDVDYLWVDFNCTDFRALQRFIKLFEQGGIASQDWMIRTDWMLTPQENTIILKLECQHKGKLAYKLAEELACYLDTISI
jgi:hypothetical protein